MSVKLALTTVTLMPYVPTLLEASSVPVTKDTVEKESNVLVYVKDINWYNEFCMLKLMLPIAS